MNHTFDVGTAVKHGTDAAIFIENLRFWIAKNKANNRHFYDGRYWTYNSATAFGELFPYWSSGQIRRIIKKLEADGVLLSGTYNQNTYDRTKWYSLNEEIHLLKSTNGSAENGKSHIDTDINTDRAPRKRDDGEAFEALWKAYPKKVGKDAARKAFDKRKPDPELLRVMIEAVEKQKDSPQWQKDDGQFIPHPATWLNAGRWLDDDGDAPSQFAGAI